jgi:hypothetical protein
MIEAPDKSSLEKVVEDLAEAPDPEGVMASQLLKAIVNRPESFVAEVRHWASGPSLTERASAGRLTRTIDLCRRCGPARIQIANPPQSLR